MAEHEYYEVNGRQIRVRPTESGQEIDEYGNFHRQPNHFTKGFGEGENPVEADRYILFWPYARDLYQIPAFRHNTYFKDFAASEDLTHAPEDYWENVYYDIVVQETDWDTIWSQPTGREALSKDPAHKWKAEI